MVDWDEVLSYQTIKLVVVRDRRLGMIHYGLQLIILGYIIYSVVHDKRYLKSEPPYGTIRATVRQPANWTHLEKLPYCLQTQPSYAGVTNNKCVYMLGTDVSYPPAIMDSIFITTRIKDTYYSLPNPNCSSLPDSYNCSIVFPRSPPADRYYLADPETYTIYMEHSIFGAENKIMTANWQCNGTLSYRSKKIKPDVMNHWDGQAGDIVTLASFLRAAQVNSLDDRSQTSGNASLRYDGALLIAIVNYQNKGNSNHLKYEYELYHITGVDVISMQPSILQSDGVTLVQRNYYGVRIVFLVIGSIGYFDFLTLLMNLVAAAVLLKLAATVVDLLILHIMPDKQTYKEHKFEFTEDFSDLRSKK